MDEQPLYIVPSHLNGSITIPSSKSHSMRALLFAMLSEGKSQIRGLLPCTDTEAMCDAIQLFGAKINPFPDHIEVTSGFGPATGVVEAGKSGLVLKLVGAVAGLLPSTTLFTGDERRPILELLGGLTQLGATVSKGTEISIRGPIRPAKVEISGIDSQPVSGLLIATSFLPGPSEIKVQNPCEQPWIEMTLSWLKKLGAKVEHRDYVHYFVEGGLKYKGFTYEVPGDFSSAAFALAAAITSGSFLTLKNLDFEDVQGDKILIDWLREMGAKIHIDRANRELSIDGSMPLIGKELDLNLCIDALPILAVIGCFASGKTRLKGAAGARLKESDRIQAICTELKKMGAAIEERPDGLIVRSSPLKGAKLFAHHDHRIAMSLAVAALGATGESEIAGSECIAKTYPTFVADFKKVGAQFYDPVRL